MTTTPSSKDTWEAEFNRTFGVNQPPVIISNPLIESEKVKSFISSLLTRTREEAFKEAIGVLEELSNLPVADIVGSELRHEGYIDSLTTAHQRLSEIIKTP